MISGNGAQGAGLRAESTLATGRGGAAEPKALRDLKKACEQFEAIFAKQLLSEMRKGENDPLTKAPGGEIYKDMMDQAIADSMAHQGALGIGKILYKQFEKAVSAGSSSGLAPAPQGGTGVPHSKEDR